VESGHKKFIKEWKNDFSGKEKEKNYEEMEV
jgi:hypothetical protein